MSAKGLDHAKQRLEASRQALFRHVNRGKPKPVDRFGLENDEIKPDTASDEMSQVSRSVIGDGRSLSAWAVAKKAALIWWHYHPARSALIIAEPLLGAYAKRHPWKLLGISAGIGAASMVIKPWKLISMTGVAIATLRSSQISAVVASLLSSDHE